MTSAERKQLLGVALILSGVVLEIATRELGGLGPAKLTGDHVASAGLRLIGNTAPCPSGAEAVERAVSVLLGMVGHD